MNEQMPVQLEDLYLLIGEKEVVRYLQQKQIMEMSKEIEKLRQELNGKLEQSPDLDTIRRVPSGVQGAGFGFGPDVPRQPDESSDRDYPTSAFPSETPRVGRSNLARSTTGD